MPFLLTLRDVETDFVKTYEVMTTKSKTSPRPPGRPHKFSDEQKAEIRLLIAQGWKGKDIRKKYGISYGLISRIRSGL